MVPYLRYHTKSRQAQPFFWPRINLTLRPYSRPVAGKQIVHISSRVQRGELQAERIDPNPDSLFTARLSQRAGDGGLQLIHPSAPGTAAPLSQNERRHEPREGRKAKGDRRRGGAGNTPGGGDLPVEGHQVGDVLRGAPGLVRDVGLHPRKSHDAALRHGHVPVDRVSVLREPDAGAGRGRFVEFVQIQCIAAAGPARAVLSI